MWSQLIRWTTCTVRRGAYEFVAFRGEQLEVRFVPVLISAEMTRSSLVSAAAGNRRKGQGRARSATRETEDSTQYLQSASSWRTVDFRIGSLLFRTI